MADHYQDIDEPLEDGRVVETREIIPAGQSVTIRTEVNEQITTAKAYPRSLTVFRKDVMAFACLDIAVAESMFYALPRGGKAIIGPSARFAEVAQQCWGNCRSAARVVDIGNEYVTAQGVFYDLEKNIAITYEVLRRITDSKGERYNADMIGVTGNAASSIALRNAILKGIPKAFWSDAFEAARKTVAGDVKTLVTRRQEMLKSFQVWNITQAQIFGLLGVKGVEDVSLDHLVQMIGVYNSIKEGELTPERAFAPELMKDPDVARPPKPTRDNAFEGGGARAKKTAKKAKPKKKNAEATVAAATKTPAGEKPPGAGEPPANQANAGEPSGQATAPAPGGGPVKEETPLERGLRLLPKCTTVKAVADLRKSIEEEIDDEEIFQKWTAACDARGKEVLEAGNVAS